MPSYELDGQMRAQLREAVLLGFQARGQLKRVVGALSKDLDKIVANAPYEEQVDELITIAFSEGWLIKLSQELIQERNDYPEVRDPISVVQAWLEARRAEHNKRWQDKAIASKAEVADDPRKVSVVISSVDPDAAWKGNFEGQFKKAIDPCQVIDALDRMKQSKDAAPAVRRDIESARLFIALVSKRYIKFQQTVEEIDHALATIGRDDSDGRPRRLLIIALDQEGANWFDKKRQTLVAAGGPLVERVIIKEFFDQNGRKSIISGGMLDDEVVELIIDVAEQLRRVFDGAAPEPALPLVGPNEGAGPPPPSSTPPTPAPVTSDKIIILGESKGVSDRAAAAAINALVDSLSVHPDAVDQWRDGWRAARRNIDVLKGRPTFVRTVVDKSATNAEEFADRLSSELKVAFDLDFDDESEKARPIHECPRVIWRPGGPDWTRPEHGPLVFSSVDQPPDLARWLTDRLGLASAGGKVPMVRYEDPIEKKNPSRTVRRRQALEDTLISLASAADTVPVGHGHLLEVVSRIGGKALTIIAAHDLDTKIDDERDTISRFQSLDRGIEQSLARTQGERVPLVLVAALFRNAKLFPQFEFSRETRIRRWQLLRFFEGPDGIYRPDEENLDRLREQIAAMSGSDEHHVLP